MTGQCPLLEEVSIHFTKVNMQKVLESSWVHNQFLLYGKGSVSQRSICSVLYVPVSICRAGAKQFMRDLHLRKFNQKCTLDNNNNYCMATGNMIKSILETGVHYQQRFEVQTNTDQGSGIYSPVAMHKMFGMLTVSGLYHYCVL